MKRKMLEGFLALALITTCLIGATERSAAAPCTVPGSPALDSSL
jgi:hypothetical protein